MIEIQFSDVHVRLAMAYRPSPRSRLYSLSRTVGKLSFADERFAMMFLINLDGELDREIDLCTNRNDKRSFVAMQKFVNRKMNSLGYQRVTLCRGY